MKNKKVNCFWECQSCGGKFDEGIIININDQLKKIELPKPPRCKCGGFNTILIDLAIDEVVFIEHAKIQMNKPKNKYILVREKINYLSEKSKLISKEELLSSLPELDKEDVEEEVRRLLRSGDIFKPKEGFLQKI